MYDRRTRYWGDRITAMLGDADQRDLRAAVARFNRVSSAEKIWPIASRPRIGITIVSKSRGVTPQPLLVRKYHVKDLA